MSSSLERGQANAHSAEAKRKGRHEAPFPFHIRCWLAPTHPQVDPEADPPDRAAARALAHDTADAPGANPADRADAAPPCPDPCLRRVQPEAEHVRHATAGRRWGRRRRRRRRRRRWRRWWRRRRRWWRRRWWRRRRRWRRRWWRCHRRDAGVVDADVVGVGTGRAAVLDEVAEREAASGRRRHTAHRDRELRPHVRVVGRRVRSG